MLPVAGAAEEAGEVFKPRLISAGLGFDRRHLRSRQERHSNQRRVSLDRPRDHARAEEDAGQRVVIVGGDRIELVIVAAGTGEGEAEEGPADDVDLIVDAIGDHPFLVDIPRHEIGNREKPRGHERIGVDPRGIVGLEQIAGELLAEKLGVGEVAIEGVDDPVAVAPRLAKVALWRELDEIASVGVADEVEPVPPPALAVARRGEQAIDDGVEGVGGIIGEKRGGLLRGRREPDEIERRPAEERPLVGGGGRLEACRFDSSEDEAVDRSPRPSLECHLRRRAVAHGLKGPVGPVGIRDQTLARGHCRRSGSTPLRPRGSLLHPQRKARDLGVGELAVGGHLDAVVGIADRGDKQARLRAPGNDRRPALPPGQHLGGRRQRQSPFGRA